ncbi:MAG: hypothetical protein DHS20C20_23970 [Ardenticatenaceae bacterium]|nr:MAG: hypothetical protein DHS20C20_23970 [Ardenticatenaceae bacterium]
MNIGTAVLILVILFAVRFLIPVGLMLLIDRYNHYVAGNPAR